MSNQPRPVTVVTGGGRGIGAATALRLARAGHDVVLSYLTDDRSAAEVAQTLGTFGAHCLTVQADVADPDQVAELFRAAVERFEVVTGLVNNAGSTLHRGKLADTPVETIRRVLDVNLLGTVLCARQAVQLMSTDHGGAGGAIVNLSSTAATLGAAGEYVHYAAAKAGVEAFTTGLAREVGGQGIRVNAVSPGTTVTRIHADAGDPDRADRVGALVPLGRAGEPDEVAAAVGWLLGPDAGYVSGAVLRVSGGR